MTSLSTWMPSITALRYCGQTAVVVVTSSVVQNPILPRNGKFLGSRAERLINCLKDCCNVMDECNTQEELLSVKFMGGGRTRLNCGCVATLWPQAETQIINIIVYSRIFT